MHMFTDFNVGKKEDQNSPMNEREAGGWGLGRCEEGGGIDRRRENQEQEMERH